MQIRYTNTLKSYETMASLNDVCYEQISGDFWYAVFGDFKLIVDKSTGYFNATKLCHSAGKRFRKWKDNERSKKLMAYFEENLRSWNSGAKTIYEKQAGNNDKTGKVISGQYVCRELILDISCWLSGDFYVKCVNIVCDYYANEFKQYATSNEELRKKLAEIQRSWEAHKEDISPKTLQPSKLHMFGIFSKNAEGKYDYYVVRAQQSSYRTAVKKLKQVYPECEIVYELKYNPNSINLYNRMKENLDYLDYDHNHFNIKEMSLDTLIRDVTQLVIGGT